MNNGLSRILETKEGREPEERSSGEQTESRFTNTAGRAWKAFLYSFILFLSISALFAIVSVVSGEIGEFELKVLATTSVIAAASICALCCSAYSGRTGRIVPGLGGIALAGLAAALLIAGIWAEAHSDEYWKMTAIVGVLAIATAHALTLLAVRLPAGHAWLRMATTINIFALAGLITLMIARETTAEGLVKIVAVLSILVALETLVIPILARVGRTARREARETLLLTKQDDQGIYRDAQGHLYQVKRLENTTGVAGPQS
jgi:hypothetical protein